MSGVGGIRKMVAAVSHKNVKSVFVGKSVFENINNAVIVTRFGNKRTRNSDFHFVVKFLNHSASFVVFNTAHNVSRDTKKYLCNRFYIIFRVLHLQYQFLFRHVHGAF